MPTNCVGKVRKYLCCVTKYLLDTCVTRIRMGVTSVSQEDIAMPYDARAVANYLYDKAKSSGESLDPMKLLKLAYFAHGWHLAIEDTPLVDEPVLAWRYGPVIRSVYNAFREYGGHPITDHAKGEWHICGTRIEWSIPHIPETARKAREIMDRVWDVYGGYTGLQLSSMTHAAGTPWRKIADEHGGNIPIGAVIPDSEIRGHFRALANANK